MSINVESLSASKSYTKESLKGLGALKGKNCIVESIVEVEGGNEVTFSWTADDGTIKKDKMIVKDGTPGADGLSPTITENPGNNENVYKLDIATKDQSFTTINLKGADGAGGSGGSGEENVQSDWNEIDENSDAFIKNKPIIPDAYDDTELAQRVSDIESDYVTETELNSKGYLTEHQDISGKVDKVEGKSLISDAEIVRLASVDNYDDTDIRTELANKADTTSIPSKVSVLENDSKYQTESDVTTTLTDYATKTYVGEQIANAEHLKREIVTVLPSDTEASDNIIYMLKVESATGNDKYQEYMKIDGTVQIVGDTSVDLTDYAKTTDIPTNTSDLTNDSGFLTEHQDISGKVDKVAGKGLSTNDLTDELKSSYDDAVTAKHTHENGTVLDKFSESNEGVLLFNGEKIESELVLDSTPTKDSKNYVNSGSVYSSLFETKQRTVIDTPENYVVCTSTDIGALEVVADDTTPTTTQVTLSVVQAFVPTAQVGEYYQHIDEVSHLEDYEDTIYREKDDSYSSIEVDEKIKEVNDRITEIASGGLKPLSLTDYQSFMDNLVISADGYVAP